MPHVLFKKRFHDGIRSGAITTTIRTWQRPQATPGNSYKLGASDRIEVGAVDVIPVYDIRPRDARTSGFASVDELVAMLRKESSRSLTPRSRVYRIRFRYRGEYEQRSPGHSRDDLLARLERMGPWSFEMLEWIGEHPGVSSAVLAEHVDRERLKVKADVRKLKRLGITRSLEVGYELTAVGKTLLSG